MVVVAVARYVEAGGRWLWELVSDIGVQLWELSSWVVAGAWRAVSGAAARGWWRLCERVRALGRAWRERDWSRLLPPWLHRKKEEEGFGLPENIHLPATGSSQTPFQSSGHGDMVGMR